MLSEALIRNVTLFFLLVLSDEDEAEQLATKTLARIRNSPETQVPMAKVVYLVESQLRRHHFKPHAQRPIGKACLIPDHLDLAVWKDFSRKTEAEELYAVVWTRVLGLQDEVVAKGLGISVGTIRHRANRGLKVLGGLLHGATQ